LKPVLKAVGNIICWRVWGKVIALIGFAEFGEKVNIGDYFSTGRIS
jgi:hypothetical protein